jgi:glycerate 2-kinase
MSDAHAVCCPDKFRGTLTAPEAAEAMAEGLRDAGIDEVVTCPLADGGEGTLDALLAGLGGERRSAVVTGPVGDPVTAHWGLLPDGTALVEMAQASGLAVTGRANDAVEATTRGTGELIALAARSGATRIVVGVGGSATTDGGLGALDALGWSLPVPVVVACDVETRFLDAARVYGPQKGATPEQVELLAERLETLAAVYLERTGVDVRRLARGGAAGGLAGGLAALGAELEPGFDVVAEAVDLEGALSGASLVMTGEGRFDSTSLSGKVVGGVLAKAPSGIRCVVICGQLKDNVLARLPRPVEVLSLAGRTGSAAEQVRAAAHQAA